MLKYIFKKVLSCKKIGCNWIFSFVLWNKIFFDILHTCKKKAFFFPMYGITIKKWLLVVFFYCCLFF